MSRSFTYTNVDTMEDLKKREENYNNLFADQNWKTLIVFWWIWVGKTHLVKKNTPEKIDFFIDEPTYSMQLTSGNIKLAPPDVYWPAKDHYALECLIRKPLIVFDDLWCTATTDAYIKTMLFWINKRMEKWLRTIITTNLTPHELETTFEKRIASRLLENSISIILKWDDLRKTKRKVVTI